MARAAPTLRNPHLGRFNQTLPPPTPIHDIVDYGKALYETITRVQTAYFERSDADVARSVFIDDLGLKATDLTSPTSRSRRSSTKA